MPNKITREQLEELECESLIDITEYHRLLKAYAGIKAKSYTGFSYYDAAGNYVGDSADSSTMDLLRAAYIEVED